jgi:hypothetical protein
MTIALDRNAGAPRAFAFRHLLTAFLMGALLATVAALTITMPRTAPAEVVTADRSTTTAGEQYRAWFDRPSDLGRPSTSASEQYVSWYLRPMAAGSTTAMEQYLDWYLRDATVPSMRDRVPMDAMRDPMAYFNQPDMSSSVSAGEERP